VAAPASAERDLLVRWLTAESIPHALPDPERVRRVIEVLTAPTGSDPGSDPRLRTGSASAQDDRLGSDRADRASTAAVHAVAAALAGTMAPAASEWIVVGTESRTHLLLEGSAPRVLPFGDLDASTLAAWAGGVRLPKPIAEHGAEWLAPVDRALSAFLEEGVGLDEALSPLPAALRDDLERILRRGAPDAGPPLVPKLGGWTPGLDLAL
jgi:hypothetical protein